MKKVETMAYIETLQRVRECRRAILRVFKGFDVLLLPTMREPAPLIAERSTRLAGGRRATRPHSIISALRC